MDQSLVTYHMFNTSFYYIEINSFLSANEHYISKFRIPSDYYFIMGVNDHYFKVTCWYLRFIKLKIKRDTPKFIKWRQKRYKMLEFMSNCNAPQVGHITLIGRGYKLYPLIVHIMLKLGYSHLVYFLFPVGVKIKLKRKKKFDFKVISNTKSELGNVIHLIQKFRIPLKYKRKGIFVTT